MSKSDDKLVVVPTDNPPKNDGSIVETTQQIIECSQDVLRMF